MISPGAIVPGLYTSILLCLVAYGLHRSYLVYVYMKGRPRALVFFRCGLLYLGLAPGLQCAAAKARAMWPPVSLRDRDVVEIDRTVKTFEQKQVHPELVERAGAAPAKI